MKHFIKDTILFMIGLFLMALLLVLVSQSSLFSGVV
ncbi:hypothetical protein phiOC_p390 [Ochrobactrum phage vB_OspM_OC]|nr:hypothetical protein phiOC_p390 [Ochrobactrum phage vB_OspM_OC]